jgi:hypothetical protein
MTSSVYTFEVVAGQEWIFPADEGHFEMFFAMDGRVISDWDPPVMKVNREIDHEERFGSDFPWLDEHVPFLRKPATILLKYAQLLHNHQGRSYSDFPWLGEHVPFLRKPAAEALGHILLEYGQLLPVRGEEVWLFNATTVLDALDHERSQIVYFEDGNILAIERYVFDEGRIGTAEVFKLPMRASPVCVTDNFVERVRSAGLRGVSFRELWNSADQ